MGLPKPLQDMLMSARGKGGPEGMMIFGGDEGPFGEGGGKSRDWVTVGEALPRLEEECLDEIIAEEVDLKLH